jgi:hypothetical protein
MSLLEENTIKSSAYLSSSTAPQKFLLNIHLLTNVWSHGYSARKEAYLLNVTHSVIDRKRNIYRRPEINLIAFWVSAKAMTIYI